MKEYKYFKSDLDDFIAFIIAASASVIFILMLVFNLGVRHDVKMKPGTEIRAEKKENGN
ncbi:MAG: hypothetical protein M0R77_00295 [Gammaproteobacteria bacterium]|nr:hypothetical protein [Acholeplasmataceae bacterium]MCK9528994.1 hypothetical protein [Gammaproteobacteria bacterium]